MGDEYDSGDDLFDGVSTNELIDSIPAKRQHAHANGDDTAPAEQLDDISSPPAKRTRLSASNDEALMQLATQILKDKFGYDSFRHEQQAAITRLLGGESSLVIFPTGAGKSLCYQVPAIAFPELDKQSGERAEGDSGVTIVVSPLIALMKDQVDALKRRGIAAECLDSTKSWEQVQGITAMLRNGELRLLYCAPERLNNEGFVQTIKHVRGGVRLIGVDEAHCISEWGHSFRPDYLKVARFVEEIKAERVVCLTATATPIVADDIRKAFSITEEGVFRTSPYRPNLSLRALAVKESDEKYDLLYDFLRKNSGSTLVYVTLQKQAEDLASILCKKNFQAVSFHAGMKVDEKTMIQDQFMASKIRIVVATVAFGMGIDKADIRNIVHWDLPSTIEEYSQQVGRAGRDGKPSQCMLYLCRKDFWIKENFARGDLPSWQSLRNLFGDIFKPEVIELEIGDTFKISQNLQVNEFDIRASPLSVIYAILELRFKMIRAVTPEYSAYSFEASPTYYPRLKNSSEPEAKAIFSQAKKKAKYHHIDPNVAATNTGAQRPAIIRLLNELNDTGTIRLKASGVVNKYRVIGYLPRTEMELDDLTDKVHAELSGREKQALERIHEVSRLFTVKGCFAVTLAKYFGMKLPEGKQKCGQCTVCLDGKAVELPPAPPKVLDLAGIRKVLAATDVRDDPRFLARVAFGIRSPRVGKLGLERDSVFMSLADHDFESLLAEFTKACNQDKKKGR